MTVNSVRQREGAKGGKRHAGRGRSRDITLISGSSISGISIWVSEIDQPEPVRR